MDKRIIRARAREKYKEMMKGVPRKSRPPFKQVFPMIKALLVKKNVDNSPIKHVADVVGDDDENLIEDMFASLDEEHIEENLIAK